MKLYFQGNYAHTLLRFWPLKLCELTDATKFPGFLTWAIPPVRLALLEEIPEKFRKDPGNALRAVPGIPVKSTAGIPQAL